VQCWGRCSVKKKDGRFENTALDDSSANRDQGVQPVGLNQSQSIEPGDLGRRSFLGKVGGMAAVAMTAGSVLLEPVLGGKDSVADASTIGYNSATRATASYDYRVNTAEAEDINVGELPDNGDLAAFPDFSAQYSKALLHTDLGVPNPKSWTSMQQALMSGTFAAFEAIQVGTPGGTANSKLNGPQGCLAFDLEGLDSHAAVIPPSPSVTSAQTAAEQVEHYWAALIRDVFFSNYSTNSTVGQAVTDMNKLSYINSNSNNEYPAPVTPQNLFRGQIYPGDQSSLMGPYVSQFLIQPTMLGAQPISQKFQTFLSASNGGADYMTSQSVYQAIQNGGASGTPNFDPTLRPIRDGRDLAAYTHVDTLYQEYLISFLILLTINAPFNPGNPYIGSKSEKAFGTFGAPDAAGTLAEMATRALKAAWFHKWIVDLRLRPEEYGALVQVRLSGSTESPYPEAAKKLNSDVLNSAAVQAIFSKYGSYLLPQAFPEGCPTHPCYPTGHGTVAGACITALKFFYDGSQKIQPLLQASGQDVFMPSSDGTSTSTYTGSDSAELTINSELSKLAFNISFGHGIHAGIHFRSSTLYSILLGEKVALSVLQDRANSYNEPFTVSITKFDGTTATISNAGNS
jgi:hypothetical protein